MALILVAGAACTDRSMPTAASRGGPEEGSPGSASLARTPPGLHLPSTVGQLLALEVGPVAIAHRGMGANLGEDPSRPIENTIDAVRQGFEAGASVVELDR